jgi:hypothetical protein
MFSTRVYSNFGRAVAQVVSRALQTTTAWIRAQVKSRKIAIDRTALGHVFCEYFGFPFHYFIPLTAPKSSPYIIQDWYSKPINSHSNSGLGSTPVYS